jgi:hypothetical protein
MKRPMQGLRENSIEENNRSDRMLLLKPHADALQ